MIHRMFFKANAKCQCEDNEERFQKETKLQNIQNSFSFRILRWTSFLMIPITFLYDEYIDRPKLSEPKKPFEYIAPPPTSGFGTIIISSCSD